MTTQDPTCLEVALGWTFRDPTLLRKALTHSTYANEHPDEGPDYERLEFLGDAVLDLIAARLLFEGLHAAREGELSRRRARVVRRETLARLAQEIDLGAYVRLGEGQRRTGAAASTRILADCYEALAGAVFLDGGWEVAMLVFSAPIGRAIEVTNEILDFKTRLQEICHRAEKSAPTYHVLSVEGPDHARVFACEVQIDGVSYGVGHASSKKAAEQQCARQAALVLEALLQEKAP